MILWTVILMVLGMKIFLVEGVMGGSNPLDGFVIEFDATKEDLEAQWKSKITVDDIKRSVRHVRSAKAQRRLYTECIEEARQHVINNVPQSARHYVLIGHYCQNMEFPFLGAEQAGETYYYTPSSVYCFGLVNTAHDYNDGVHGVLDHMHSHVYEECVGGKGGNNVASLIMRGLGPEGMNILCKGQPGGKLTFVL